MIIIEIKTQKDINDNKLHKECKNFFNDSFDHLEKVGLDVNPITFEIIGNEYTVKAFLNFTTELNDSEIEILRNQLNDLIFSHNAIDPIFLLSGNSDVNELGNINHDRKSLQVKNIYVTGLLKEIEYYQDYNVTTGIYSVLVVKEVRTFFTNIYTGYTHSRNLDIHYYLDNGQIGYSILNQMKYYINIDEQDKNLKERRTIVLAEAKKWLLESYLIPTFGMIALQYALEFLSELTQSMEKYVNGTHIDLQNTINNTTLSFITPEVKTQLQTLITYQNLEVV
jgi:hypothetical protein